VEKQMQAGIQPLNNYTLFLIKSAGRQSPGLDAKPHFIIPNSTSESSLLQLQKTTWLNMYLATSKIISKPDKQLSKILPATFPNSGNSSVL